MSEYRHELKYLINQKQAAIINISAKALMLMDEHAGDKGYYTIRSLYFDDMNDMYLNENLAGSDPRCKYRIRYYNNDLNYIVLEKKSKINSMCKKESCLLTREQCESLIGGDTSINEKDNVLINEIKLKGLIPKIIVTYNRVPYTYSGGNVRVTFDKDICSSTEIKRFLDGDYINRPIFEKGELLLETKWDELFPLHLKETLNIEGLNQTAFSKYTMCRLYHN